MVKTQKSDEVIKKFQTFTDFHFDDESDFDTKNLDSSKLIIFQIINQSKALNFFLNLLSKPHRVEHHNEDLTTKMKISQKDEAKRKKNEKSKLFKNRIGLINVYSNAT